MNDTKLFSTYILLDSREQEYALQILGLSDFILTKNILPITFCIGDRNAQPEKLLEYD